MELRDEDRSVEIEVEWPASYKASCPECGRACAVYDHAAKPCPAVFASNIAIDIHFNEFAGFTLGAGKFFEAHIDTLGRNISVTSC